MIERISKVLSPYKNQVGAVAGIVTILQFFSGIPVCLDIKRRGTTAGFSVMPFLGGTVFGMINLQFGFILNDDTMIRVNFLGLFLNIIYLTVFYFFTPGPEKTALWAKIGYSGAFVAALLAYCQLEDPANLEFRLGMLLTAFLFILIGFPLLSVPELIRKKSSEGLPFPIIASGTFVGFMWLLYGFCINNSTIVIQNVIALLLSIPQIVLCLLYPSSPSDAADTKTTKAKKAKKSN